MYLLFPLIWYVWYVMKNCKLLICLIIIWNIGVINIDNNNNFLIFYK